METVTIVLYGVIVLFLLHLSWVDFKTLRIPNTYVLILIGLYALFAASRGFVGWHLDLMAGAGMFALGFLFWLIGMMGAGDAKLYFPLGLLSSVIGLFPYVVLLSATSIIFFLLIMIAGWLKLERPYVMARLAEIKATRQVPYSVPMVLSLIGVLSLRVFVVP